MTEVPVTAPPPVGIASVDAVLDLVAGIHERPVAEHVAAFEQAHVVLRDALDAPVDEPSAAPA